MPLHYRDPLTTPEESLQAAIARIGQTGMYSVQRRKPATRDDGSTPKLTFPVVVLEAKLAGNRPIVRIRPVNGHGSWWVALFTIQFDD